MGSEAGSKTDFSGEVRILESDDGVELVFESFIVNSAHGGEAIALFGEDDSFIDGGGAIKGGDVAGGHVAQQDAVAYFVLRVDEPGEPVTFLIEGEIGDVAEIEFGSGGEIAQDKVGALGLVFRFWRSGSRWRGRGCGGGRIAMERDAGGAFARETEATDAGNFGGLALREIDEKRFGLGRLVRLLELLGLFHGGIDLEGEEVGIGGEGEIVRRGLRAGRREGIGAGEFAHGVTLLLAGGEVADDDFGIAIVGRKFIGEPLAVVRNGGILDALPSEDVGELDGDGRFGIGCGGGEGGRECEE